MCIVCQESIPHPSIQEIPIYYSLLQVAILALIGYWLIYKVRVQEIIRSLFIK